MNTIIDFHAYVWVSELSELDSSPVGDSDSFKKVPGL